MAQPGESDKEPRIGRLRTIIDWTDVRRPTRFDLAVVVGGYLTFVVTVTLIILAADALITTPSAGHSTTNEAAAGVSTGRLAMLLVGAWLVSIFEEYVFRNLLQKLLYTWFHYGWAILITTLIFTSLHVPAYGGIAQNLTGMVQPLAVVFAGSLILGYAYWRSENIVVPMVLHAVINTQALLIAVVL